MSAGWGFHARVRRRGGARRVPAADVYAARSSCCCWCLVRVRPRGAGAVRARRLRPAAVLARAVRHVYTVRGIAIGPRLVGDVPSFWCRSPTWARSGHSGRSRPIRCCSRIGLPARRIASPGRSASCAGWVAARARRGAGRGRAHRRRRSSSRCRSRRSSRATRPRAARRGRGLAAERAAWRPRQPARLAAAALAGDLLPPGDVVARRGLSSRSSCGSRRARSRMPCRRRRSSRRSATRIQAAHARLPLGPRAPRRSRRSSR